MRNTAIFFITILFFLLYSSPIHASLVSINPDGEVVVNVLGSEDALALEIPQSESLKVSAKDTSIADNSLVLLEKNNNEVVLSVSDGGEDKELNITDVGDSVIEIEERPQKDKLSISISENSFLIENRGVVAVTDYEITVDPKKARILLDAPSGKRFLSITPYEATQTLLRAHTLDVIDSKTGISVVESDEHDLTYKVEGEKILNLFNVYYHHVDVVAYVSALTGEIVKIDEPQWLTITDFLFS